VSQQDNIARDFNSVPWQILIGIKTDETRPSIAGKVDIQMAITPEVVLPSGPDKSQPAVHFANWLDSNKNALLSIWSTEYAQYMNLRRRDTAAVIQKADVGLVDPTGKHLGSSLEQ
jgi:hypothetical protein